MSSALWVDPRSVRFKITPHHDLGRETGGDWDIERRYLLTDAVKHRAIVQRYRDGKRWEETDLFTDCYRRRFEAGETVRGEPTMEALLAQYYNRVDSMFDYLKRKGFKDCYSLPIFLIGRDGEVFIGNQGNHRLAMAQVIGLNRIAGEVICRHRMTCSTAA